MNRDRHPVDRETAATHASLLATCDLTEGEWQALQALALLFQAMPDAGRLIRLVTDCLEGDGGDQ